MPWYVLLIVALASLGLVLVMLARVGLKAWRLARHGVAVSRRVGPLAGDLGRRADEAAGIVERLSVSGGQLGANIARIQASLARLQVVAQATSDALFPYRLVMGWLRGERELTDLDT